jgi:hypothetical protein
VKWLRLKEYETAAVFRANEDESTISGTPYALLLSPEVPIVDDH